MLMFFFSSILEDLIINYFTLILVKLDHVQNTCSFTIIYIRFRSKQKLNIIKILKIKKYNTTGGILHDKS